MSRTFGKSDLFFLYSSFDLFLHHVALHAASCSSPLPASDTHSISAAVPVRPCACVRGWVRVCGYVWWFRKRYLYCDDLNLNCLLVFYDFCCVSFLVAFKIHFRALEVVLGVSGRRVIHQNTRLSIAIHFFNLGFQNKTIVHVVDSMNSMTCVNPDCPSIVLVKRSRYQPVVSSFSTRLTKKEKNVSHAWFDRWAVQTQRFSLPFSLGPELSRFWANRTSVSPWSPLLHLASQSPLTSSLFRCLLLSRSRFCCSGCRWDAGKCRPLKKKKGPLVYLDVA